MKLGILHLTDIHFTEKTDLNIKMDSFCKTIINEMQGISKLYIVLSGDIAFSGKKEEYEKTAKFLSITKTMLKNELKSIEIKYIIVPGNHDCNFALDSQIRKNSVSKIDYTTIGEDNSVIDICLGVQKDFWDFYEKYNPLPTNKLFYTISEQIEDKYMNFCCINTAWVSQLNEVAGSLFFPVTKFQNINTQKGHINFGVWHHPYNWFNPNTIENNKSEFEKFTERISSTHFFGHEHEQSNYVHINRNEDRKTNLLSGDVFNEDRKNKSGFQILKFDINSENGTLNKYCWKNTSYINEKNTEIELYKEFNESLKINNDFLKSIQEVKIPILLDNKKDLKLSDIFIFPDLESTSREINTFDGYSSSQKLIDKEYSNCILEGDSQVGKTSLLYALYLKLHDNSICPLLIKGKEIKDLKEVSELNIEKLIKKIILGYTE